MTDPEWMARRSISFGASEVASVMVALGLRDPEQWAPSSWTLRNANFIKVKGGNKVPRIFLQKAGIKKPFADSPEADAGRRREWRLMDRWRELSRTAETGASALIDPSSVQFTGFGIPLNIMPLIDRYCPSLSATPDGWARDGVSRFVTIDAKCSYHPYRAKWEGGIPPHVFLQKQAQMSVCAADYGLVVEGEEWSATWKDDRGLPPGPVVTHRVDRDDDVIEEIRQAVTKAMGIVKGLRA